jgi:hypothetical protein
MTREAPFAAPDVRGTLRRMHLRLALVALLAACGDDPAPATPSTTPPAEPPPTEPPAEPPAEPALPPDDVRSRGEVGVYTTDIGGLVRHGDVLVRFGDGEPAVLGRAARARCTVSMSEARSDLHAGSWAHLTITSTPATPEDAAFCARFAGTFVTGHPSDPRAGGPPPPPTFPGSECLLLPQLASATEAACATIETRGAAYEPTAFIASIYAGDCCAGAITRSLEVPGTARGFLMPDDGSSLVALVRDPFVAAAEVAADPVVFVVARDGGARELHLGELFAGDPILTQGVGFAVQARLEGTELVVRTAGGESHRHPL